jgi:hypothetical protein
MARQRSAQADTVAGAFFIVFGILFCLGVFYLARHIIRKADEERE